MDGQAQWTPATQTSATWGGQAQLTPQQLQQAMSLLQPQANSQVGNAQQLQNTQITPDLAKNLLTKQQSTILPYRTNITQRAGAWNPDVEVFSGGRALDSSFAAAKNTPVSLPSGKWQVLTAYNGAGEGKIGDSSNEGWGNSLRAKNIQTQEIIHLSHLGQVGVSSGQIIPGGQVIATTSNSGNSTGPTLGIQYFDPQGNLGDILSSPYSQYIMPPL